MVEQTTGAPSASTEDAAALASGSVAPDTSGTAAPAIGEAAVADANAADSSIAGGAKPDAKPKSMLDAVVSALDTKKPGEGEASPASKEGATGQPAGDAKAPKDGADDPPPFHEHPRWQAQLAENKALKTKVEELFAPADNFRKVENFMALHSLTHEEVADGFQIMALMKGKPLEALAALTPIVDRLRAFAGEILPADLQADVERGAISEDRAKELARSRNSGAAAEASALALRNATATEAAATRASELTNAMTDAVVKWEGPIKAKDLDYALKEPLITARIHELVTAHGKPQTVDNAVALAKRAYDDVTAHLKTARLTRPSVRGNTVGGGTNAAPARPKNMQEAIAASLR